MIIFRICSSVFLIFSSYALGHAGEHFPFLAQVSKELVNIRAGANTNFEKVGQLSKGNEIVVLGKVYDWYKVQLPVTSKVYIREDYLKLHSDLIAELVGDQVNVRAENNSDSSSLGILKKGDLVKLIKQNNGWWQIEPPVQSFGWIRQDFLIVKSLVVVPSLIREVIVLPVQVKSASLATTDVKGKLMSLLHSKVDMQYELFVNGKVAYYIQSALNLERFKGAMVLIKGIIVSEHDHRYDHPVLRVINISLLL